MQTNKQQPRFLWWLNYIETVPFKNSIIDIPKKKWTAAWWVHQTVNAISHTKLIILYKWFISIKKKSHLTLADGPDLPNLLPTPRRWILAHTSCGRISWVTTDSANSSLATLNDNLSESVNTGIWNHMRNGVPFIIFLFKKKRNCILQKQEETRCWTCFFPDSSSKMICFFVWGTNNIFVWTEAFIEVLCVRVWVATGILFTPSLWHE